MPAFVIAKLAGKFEIRAVDVPLSKDTIIQVVKTSNGEVLDLEEEPVILFRAKDKFAVKLLLLYQELCVKDGCTDYHLEKVREVLTKFSQYQVDHPEKMKQPGCSKGK